MIYLEYLFKILLSSVRGYVFLLISESHQGVPSRLLKVVLMNVNQLGRLMRLMLHFFERAQPAIVGYD
jgi:hypothetical protein